MDNKLKNWADNFRPTPDEEVWSKIVVRRKSTAKKKLSLKPNILIAAISVIALCILIIVLNYIRIFKNLAPNQKQTDKSQKEMSK